LIQQKLEDLYQQKINELQNLQSSGENELKANLNGVEIPLTKMNPEETETIIENNV